MIRRTSCNGIRDLPPASSAFSVNHVKDGLGLKAVLPLLEEKRDVKTAAEAAAVSGERKTA